ncbi:MAG TPA: alpha/beta hydrolase family protein, partial [Rugosimonospora sp.]|nr:alpha/beta hydrolase family protein [Rugosimonospora sp.]
MRRKFWTVVALSAVVAFAAVNVVNAWSATVIPVNCSPAPDATGVVCRAWSVAPQSDGSTLIDITLNTPAIVHAPNAILQSSPAEPAVPVHVEVYLPPNYQPTGAAYPAVYLLHGGGATYQEWSDPAKGSIVTTLQGTAFHGIAVMPEGGLAGWYTDWAGRTDGSFAPGWETFHTKQLIPWIDAHFNTVKDRSGRAIAGVSMGGFGALKYAADHPELFSAVGSFSGGTDLRTDVARSIISDSMWQAGAATALAGLTDGNFRVNLHASDGSILNDQIAQTAYRLDTLFGTPITGPSGPPDWPASDPIDRATAGAYQAYSTKLAMYVGGCSSQQPNMTQTTAAGSTNSAGCLPSPLSGEKDARLAQQNFDFDKALTTSGVVHRFCTGTGTHSWPFWQTDMVD